MADFVIKTGDLIKITIPPPSSPAMMPAPPGPPVPDPLSKKPGTAEFVTTDVRVEAT